MLQLNYNINPFVTNEMTSLNNIDMNNYPNVLTPPMESSDSTLLSPPSGSNSPPQLYFPYLNTPVLHIQNDQPYLTMIEHPVERFRFRYKSEMSGTHGCLNGRTSDRARKQTFPSIQLHNFHQQAVLRCTLYQHGNPDMLNTRQPHAHRLVKKHGNDEIDDPHDIIVSPDCGYVANFHSMGIIHTARKSVKTELIRKHTILKKQEIGCAEAKYRDLSRKETMEIDALAEKESKCINLNVVCLRFDAFHILNDIYYPLCPPIYSNAINNLKSALTGDLKIVRMDHCTSPGRGGKEIFLFVEKVSKKNIKVRFYELDDDDNEIWSDTGRFTELDVHHQYAIAFRTPPYKLPDIEKPVKVYIELFRPSDQARSESKDFTYTPCDITIGKKRARYSTFSSSSFSSDELPLTINNDTESLPNMVNSIELENALKCNNINSDEFDKVCNAIFNSGSMDIYFDENINRTDLKSLGLTMDNAAGVSNLKVSPQPLTPSDNNVVKKAVTELLSFMKTKPPKHKIPIMLQSLFSTYISTNGNSILHLLIDENDHIFLRLLLNMLMEYDQKHLVNLQNHRGETPLHLAVSKHNIKITNNLICNYANTTLQDNEGNTPLHTAILKNCPINIIKMLLKCGRSPKEFIDIENYEGFVPLHLAVNMKNLEATKLLCENNANVNLEHKRNGSSILHMAVEDQNLEITSYIIGETNIQCIKDYSDRTPLKIAKILMTDSNQKSIDIYSLVKFYMDKIGICEEIDIKEEVEEMSDEEIEQCDELPTTDTSVLRTKYSVLNKFTDAGLDEVCKVINKSGTWENLADLLDYGYLLKTDLFNNIQNPTKTLLNFALSNGDTLLQIRDFLEYLDEIKAVELMDAMVQQEIT